MQAFVPKNRKPKFELHLKIIDLNNVPLVSGTSFIKWHLPHSTSAEHRGRTPKQPIKDHKVDYLYETVVPLRLTIDKNGMLQESNILFEVVQEYGSGSRGERVTLGHVKLNLSEYVEASEQDDRTGKDGDVEERGVTRRYLMQDSKINSTIKISIYMRQIDGDRNFTAPTLRAAQVFAGIAGIITSEQANHPDGDEGAAPSLTRSSREAGELADMYRRTLTASWFSQPGELAADQCIEDIFAGGDGWGDRRLTHNQRESSMQSMHSTLMGGAEESRHASDDEKDHGAPGGGSKAGSKQHSRNSSDGLTASISSDRLRSKWRLRDPASKRPPSPHRAGTLDGLNMSDSTSSGGTATPHLHSSRSQHHMRNGSGGAGVGGRASLEQQAHAMKAEVEKARRRPAHEVDEFKVKEDLKSWRL